MPRPRIGGCSCVAGGPALVAASLLAGCAGPVPPGVPPSAMRPRQDGASGPRGAAPGPFAHPAAAAARWVAVPELSDEFNESHLDGAKWIPAIPGRNGSGPGFFRSGSVSVSWGRLHLTMRRESLAGLPDGHRLFTAAAVSSVWRLRYGYLEVRARAMDARASSVFRLGRRTPETNAAITVFDIGGSAPGHEHAVRMGAAVSRTLPGGRVPEQTGTWTAPVRPADRDHLYGLEWSPEHLKVHVDGRLVWEAPNTHWHQPLHVRLAADMRPDRFGRPSAAGLPAAFSIDYIRVWKRADEPPALPVDTCAITFPGLYDRSLRGRTKTYRLRTEDGSLLALRATHSGGEHPWRATLTRAARAPSRDKAQAAQRFVLRDRSGRRLALTFTPPPGSAERLPSRLLLAPAAGAPVAEEAHYDFVTESGRAVRMRVEFRTLVRGPVP